MKHYSLSKLENGNYKLKLTSLISPRSKKMMNILGFDPAYGFFKFVDFLTFKQFNLFEKGKAKMELFMMELHANVHEVMLHELLKPRK